MKKILMFFVAALALSLTSCKFVRTEAVVDIEVKKGTVAVENEEVHMFSDNADTSNKANARRSRLTDAAGVARFNLQSPIDFAPSWLADHECTYFFAVFDKEGNRIAQTMVTVSTGEHRTATLKIP